MVRFFFFLCFALGEADEYYVIELSGVEDAVSASGPSQKLTWRLSSEYPTQEIHFWSSDSYLASDDYLEFFTNEQVFTRFTNLKPLPSSMTFYGRPPVMWTFSAADSASFFNLQYKIVLHGYVKVLGNYYPTASLATLICGVCVAIVMISLCIVWLIYTRRSLRIILERSQVVVYSGPPGTNTFYLPSAGAILMRTELSEERNLKGLPVKEVASSENSQECSLCLEAFSEGELMRMLGCSHGFHKDCIDKWFRTQRFRKRTCPLCRGIVFATLPVGAEATAQIALGTTSPPTLGALDSDAVAAAPRAEPCPHRSLTNVEASSAPELSAAEVTSPRVSLDSLSPTVYGEYCGIIEV